MDLLLDYVWRNTQTLRRRESIEEKISPFGWADMTWQEWRKRSLLGEAPGDFESGRCTILGCAQDADTVCGAISVRLVRKPDAIVWQDFAFEADGWCPADLEPFAGLGPFRFALVDYTRVISEVACAATPGYLGAPMPTGW